MRKEQAWFAEEATAPVDRGKVLLGEVFVGYPYHVYPSDDYRRVFSDLEREFRVRFIFADETITDQHILLKIQNLIAETRFGIYDVSGWNPNVALELGLAMGMNQRWYIAVDPTKTAVNEVPSDLRGYDRIEYRSYSVLTSGVRHLLNQEIDLHIRELKADYSLNYKREALQDVLPTQRRAMMVLATSPEGLSEDEISESLDNSPVSGITLLSELVATGLIEVVRSDTGPVKYRLA